MPTASIHTSRHETTNHSPIILVCVVIAQININYFIYVPIHVHTCVTWFDSNLLYCFTIIQCWLYAWCDSRVTRSQWRNEQSDPLGQLSPFGPSSSCRILDSHGYNKCTWHNYYIVCDVCVLCACVYICVHAYVCVCVYVCVVIVYAYILQLHFFHG